MKQANSPTCTRNRMVVVGKVGMYIQPSAIEVELSFGQEYNRKLYLVVEVVDSDVHILPPYVFHTLLG